MSRSILNGPNIFNTAERLDNMEEGTLPSAIFLFQIFLNYLSHKCVKIEITV